MTFPKRGEVYWVALDPAIGSEIKKTRPAVIVSNNIANKFSNHVIVAPVTSNITKIYPFEVGLELPKKKGKIMLDQLRTVDKSRLGKKITCCNQDILNAVDKALKIVLELD